MPEPTITTPLEQLEDTLAAVSAVYGPAVIAPPDAPSDPVAVLLPVQVRYCVRCAQWRDAADMLTAQ